jgi:SAM-dependent MidA family methyltransferase
VECGVGCGDGRFDWVVLEIQNPDLLAAIEPLGEIFPDGYRCEVRTNLQSFLSPLAAALQDGLMIWIDYGFARPEFYHPDRRSGTLRTFSKHRAGENPLDHPGDVDITAHVDFTALAQAAMELGARPIEFQNQGSWLTGIAREWLLEQEENPQASLLRQFLTLTHPGHLGRSFHAIELSWQISAMVSDPLALHHRLFGDT